MVRPRKTADLTPWDLAVIQVLIESEGNHPKHSIHKDSLETLRKKIVNAHSGRLNKFTSS